MSSRFRFVVEVELERIEGKFAGRDEMAEQILSMLENANEGSIDGIGSDGMSNYEIVGWDVNEEEIRKPKRLINLDDYPIMQQIDSRTGEPIGPPIDTRRLSHSDCTHPKTPAARAACRANREKSQP